MKLPALAAALAATVVCASHKARRGPLFKKSPPKKSLLQTAQLNKLAIALTVGALSLTACSAAPTTGAAASSAATQASRPAAAATASAAKSSAAKPSAAKPAATESTAAKSAATESTAPKSEATESAATEPALEAAAGTPAAAVPGIEVAASAAGAVAPTASAAEGGAQAATAKGSTSTSTAVAPAAVQAVATTSNGSQAATARGWGAVVAGDEFSKAGAPDSTKWGLYSGAGHAGKGVRSPQAWSVANGVATVTGNSAGTTGGMSAKFAYQKYGKWETRMRTNARDTKYHPVVLLWPNSPSPKCAEIDYAEGSSSTAKIQFFLHYACGGSNFQTSAVKSIDTTQWHNYAVEWTAAGVTGYIDGVKTFSDTNPAHQPTVGMHQTLQLDWFPDGSATKPSQMQVDWVRVYK